MRTSTWTATLRRGGQALGDLEVLDGSVEADIGSAPTRTMRLSVPQQWLPLSGADPLDPRSRTEVVLAQVVDGVSHPMGVYLITKPSLRRDGGRVSVSVQCPDRSVAVRRALLVRPLVINAGELVHGAIGRILADRAPWLPQALSPSSTPLPAAWAGAAGDDPWEACERLASAAGLRLLIDAQGRATLRPLTSPLLGDVVATWSDGARGVTVEVTRDLDGSDMVDAVLVPWREGTLLVGPASAQTIGRVTGDASLISTAAQAQEVGQAELLMRRGMTEQIGVTVWSDPGVDVGDAVRVVDSRLGLDVVARVLSISRSMTSQVMSVRLASRRL